MKYSSVRAPRWSSPEKDKIDCFVKFNHLKVEVPFTADPTDFEPHGREIFDRCATGEFGEVEEYVPRVQGDEPLGDAGGGEPPKLVQGWPEIEKFIEQANIEVQRGTSRGIILVWSTMIEELLGQLIEAFLIDHAQARELIWKGAQSSLGGFSGRSKAAFALGLISRTDLTVCDRIRTVRNTAAHEWNLNLGNPAFRAKAVPALRALYDIHHAEFYHWDEQDLRFLVGSVFADSCGFLAVRLAEARAEVLLERRREKLDP